MQFSRTLLAASLALLITGQGPLYAAPPLSMDNGTTALTAQNSNAWVEISAGALQHNIRTLQAELGGKSKLCAVLKADAYGHGIGLVMPSIIAQGVPCVAVASNEEARVVRASGFTGQLVRVRLASLGEVEDALQYDMEELVGSAEFARQLDAIAERHGKTLRIHMALNSSGMSRNGVEMTTWSGRGEALQITDQKHLQLVALMTHFAVEDKDDVRKGLAAFNEQTDWLIKHAKLDRSKLTLHAANSFATLEVPEAHLDMVRTGGALFGDTVPTRTEYQRVMQFKSHVAAVHSYPAGNTVGYDRTFTLARDSRLANITVGYSDGYRRVFTNKGHVLINGHRVPVVGKVSMNTLMVDVTDFPDVKGGNEVVLFGKQAGGEITQAEIEEINGALLADLYTVWGSSNPKILVD
ncbi:alanine racemase [Pseudomonas shirazica]|uniref:Broad specificity amino-acid racemase n=2 Tax=Pseudomonas TaxID=286 RepID=A0A0B5KBK3_PSEDL|nr:MULTISPECIES: alanine racemase [Pseudomonas]MDY4311291.1 alanine racemase [Pseudomonas putida]AJG12956.1 alanine racemase [Pseudomonas plecoglossicida]ESW36222.1 alanine racemase [Pseudomonas taiwanensis SJ9]MBF8789931.1 alanine racemase [Pseudomonas asiatica]MDY4320877.1 alanine racemase [Pseudomonas putida]